MAQERAPGLRNSRKEGHRRRERSWQGRAGQGEMPALTAAHLYPIDQGARQTALAVIIAHATRVSGTITSKATAHVSYLEAASNIMRGGLVTVSATMSVAEVDLFSINCRSNVEVGGIIDGVFDRARDARGLSHVVNTDPDMSPSMAASFPELKDDQLGTIVEREEFTIDDDSGVHSGDRPRGCGEKL